MTRMWKIAIGVGALIALAIATVGFVGAQTGGASGSGPLGTFVSKLAANLGISEDKLNTAIDQTQLQMIDDALANGQITEDQAAQLRDRVNSGEGGLLGPILGHELRKHRIGFAIGMEALQSYADAAGITKADLISEWQGEGTLGDVLKSHGVDTAAVTSQIVSDLESRLTDKGVAQDRIDQAVTNTTDKLNQLLASEDPPQPRWEHDGGPGGYFDNGTADATDAVTPTF